MLWSGPLEERTQWRKKWEVLPRDRWQVFIPDAHPGYISWQQYGDIDLKLSKNALAYGIDRHHGPAREGPALLQGRVIVVFVEIECPFVIIKGQISLLQITSVIVTIWNMVKKYVK